MEGIIYHTDGSTEEVSKVDSEVTLKYLQDVVGGYIEIVPLGNGDVMVVNEEGKLNNLLYNEQATKVFQEKTRSIDDFIVGSVLVTKSKYIS